MKLLCQNGKVVSISASHFVGIGFAPCLGHIKDHQKMVQIASLFGKQVLSRCLTEQCDCLKGWSIGTCTEKIFRDQSQENDILS